jgi:hypothetical protein
MRGGDDLVTGPDLQRGHRQIKRIGAIGAGYAMVDLDRASEFPLEGIDIGPANERCACAQLDLTRLGVMPLLMAIIDLMHRLFALLQFLDRFRNPLLCERIESLI